MSKNSPVPSKVLIRESLQFLKELLWAQLEEIKGSAKCALNLKIRP